jgi:hypothetical protein
VSALRAASKATFWTRAPGSSGVRTRVSSSIGSTRGIAARTVARSATTSLAQPDSTSSWASAVRAKPPTSSAAPDPCARRTSTSRTFG